jgi:hypothetical protein
MNLKKLLDAIAQRLKEMIAGAVEPLDTTGYISPGAAKAVQEEHDRAAQAAALITSDHAGQLLKDLWRDARPILEARGVRAAPGAPTVRSTFFNFAGETILNGLAVTPLPGGNEAWAEVYQHIIQPRRQFLTVYPSIVTNGHLFNATANAAWAAGEIDAAQKADIILESREEGQQYSAGAHQWVQRFEDKRIKTMNALLRDALGRGYVPTEEWNVMAEQGRSLPNIVESGKEIFSAEVEAGTPYVKSSFPVWGAITTPIQDQYIEMFSVTDSTKLKPAIQEYLLTSGVANIAALEAKVSAKTADNNDLATLEAFGNLVASTQDAWASNLPEGIGQAELRRGSPEISEIAVKLMQHIDIATSGGTFDSTIQAMTPGGTFGSDIQAAEARMEGEETASQAKRKNAEKVVDDALFKVGVLKANVSAEEYLRLTRMARTTPLEGMVDHIEGIKEGLKTSKADAAAAAKTVKDTATEAAAKAKTVLAARKDPTLGRPWVKKHLGKAFGIDVEGVPDDMVDRLYQAFRNDGQPGLDALIRTGAPAPWLGGLAYDGLPVITSLSLDQAISDEQAAKGTKDRKTTAAITEARSQAFRAATNLDGQPAPILDIDVSDRVKAQVGILAGTMTPEEFQQWVNQNHDWISTSKERESEAATAAKAEAEAASAAAAAAAVEASAKQVALNRVWQRWQIEAKDVPASIVSELGEIFAEGGPEALDRATTPGGRGVVPKYTPYYIEQVREQEERDRLTTELADPANPGFLEALREPLIKALGLRFGAEGFADPNVGRYFEDYILPNVASGFANAVRDDPRRYGSAEALNEGFSDYARRVAGGLVITDSVGNTFGVGDINEGLGVARRTTREGEAFSFLGSLGIQIPDTGDPALNRQFAIGEIGPDKWADLVAQPPGALTSQIKEQLSLTGDIPLPAGLATPLGFGAPGGVPETQTALGAPSGEITDDTGRPYTPQERDAGLGGNLPFVEQEEFDRNREVFESRRRNELYGGALSSFPGLPLSGGFAQMPIQFPRTQIDPITGEARTLGYGDFPYSMPNAPEMQELLGDVATDDPEYLSFLIGSKDAPGPAFGLLERYPQLAGSFVKGERDKFREEAIRMSQARRGLGGGITYEEWEEKLAENQAKIADEKAQQRAAFADINATDWGDDPLGTARAKAWATAAGMTKTQEINPADYNIVGGFKSPVFAQHWVEGEPGTPSGYPSTLPQMATGAAAPPGSGGKTFYDPIKTYLSQQRRDVKPPSFATMFGEREPGYRSQFEATPQFQFQQERREDEVELERTRKLQRTRTFVI